MNSIEDTIAEIEEREGQRPVIITTSARIFPNTVGYKELSDKIFEDDRPYLLLFGTGWGLTDEVMDMSDYILEPIRGNTHGVSKLTRDKKQAQLHDKDPERARYFSYGFYYSMFKNLIKLSGYVNPNLPILIISGSHDLVSMNSHLARKLYNMYKSENVNNLTIIIYPGAKHELLMETNYKQVQNDILNFFNSVACKCQKMKSV